MLMANSTIPKWPVFNTTSNESFANVSIVESVEARTPSWNGTATEMKTTAASPALVTSASTANLTSPAGSVHYKTTGSSGWNNQRQGAMMAWVVAYLTGHTFEHKTFHPAFTGAVPDKGNYRHGDLWDLEYLGRYVNVRNITHTKMANNYQYKFHFSNVFKNMTQVQALSKYKTISYDSPWSFMQHTFPWLDPWKEPGNEVFTRLIESFTYTQVIQNTAEQVVQEIGVPFIGIHVRKNRLPALSLSCQDLGFTTIDFPGHKDRYIKGGCKGITWQNVVDKVFPNNTLPVYIAHDGTGKRNDLPASWQSFDFDFVRTLKPALISAVEQEILIRAEYFVAATHSSWSEYVIYKRALTKKDGKKNYDIWVENLKVWVGKRGGVNRI